MGADGGILLCVCSQTPVDNGESEGEIWRNLISSLREVISLSPANVMFLCWFIVLNTAVKNVGLWRCGCNTFPDICSMFSAGVIPGVRWVGGLQGCGI